MIEFGNKFNVLKKLGENKELNKFILESFPFTLEELDQDYVNKLINNKSQDYEKIYREVVNLLKNKYGAIIFQVKDCIGDSPWIIRSSGDEDSKENPNAGAFESNECHDENSFLNVLASTMLSGLSSRATKQSESIENGAKPRIIPVFIQKLINSKVTDCDIKDQVPFIDETQINKIREVIINVHKELKLERLDLEWVIESLQGPISCTSISQISQNNCVEFELAMGFGLFSTQHCTNSVNQMFINYENEISYQINNFKRIDIDKIWLVQARPAIEKRIDLKAYPMNESSKDMLLINTNIIKNKFQEIIILANNFEYGNYIVAKTLIQAWDIYISLSKEKQQSINYVFVEIGSKLEHAGIMYSQRNITVIRCNISRIPNNNECKALIDFENDIIFIGNSEALQNVTYNQERLYKIKSGYNKLYFVDKNSILKLKTGEKDLIEKPKVHTLVEPTLECMFNNGKNIYSPCYLHYEFTKSLIEGRSFETALMECTDVSDDTLYYLEAIYFSDNKKKYTFVNYHYFTENSKTENVGLLWLLIKFDKLNINLKYKLKLYSFLQKNNISEIDTFKIIKNLMNFIENVELFNIFIEEEKSSIYNKAFGVLEQQITSDNIILFLSLISHNKISPYYISMFLDNNNINLRLVHSYIELRENIALVGQRGYEHLTYELENVINSYKKLNNLFNRKTNIINSYYHQVVELFDDFAKKIAENLFREYNKELYSKYITTLNLFLKFIKFNTENLYLVDKIEMFLKNQSKVEGPKENYDLKEYSIASLLYEHSVDKDKEIEFENLHQVHNLLHQWALLEAPAIDYVDIPSRLKELLIFSNTFCENDNDLLRFEAKLIEIKLSMCTHKASFILSEDSMRLEFSEPPETMDDEIGRLVALDNVIDKVLSENFQLEHFYQKQLGSWVWIVYAKSKKEFNTINDFKKFILVARCFLDSSYDFSHTNIEKICEAEKYYDNSVWKSIFKKMIEYRQVFDDSNQHIDLRSYVHSTFFTEISINADLREKIKTCYINGFEACLDNLVRDIELIHRINEVEQWSEIYNSIRYRIMVLIINWPYELLERINELDDYDDISILIIRNLLVRKDIQNKIDGKYEQYCSLEMLLHCCPHLIINDDNVVELCEYIRNKERSYKYAKQYILFKYINKIDIETINQFVTESKWVPFTKEESDISIYENIEIEKNYYKINNSILGYIRGL